MQITITARHFDLTNAIRDYVEESARKLEKYFDHILNVHFVLALGNGGNTAEMILHIPKNNLKCVANEKDMYMAIDAAIDKMENQVKKLKDKWSDHQKRSLKQNSQYVYANLIEKGTAKRTVKTKRIMAEELTVNEAIDKFEEIDDPYFIFKNIATDRINVLVKKGEEHYKLIEP
ncbi:MAG: ribosome-associated, sigma 54 modulation protein (modular protein) [Candidatus Cloacimonas sp. SDB]|nr:MAG: ribosome-associated, sigma 54 modulation protein (modular protein) [Candidatus Cloacimonas sp. SDB]